MPAGAEAAVRAFYGGLLGLPELVKPSHLAARGGCWFGPADRELHLGVEADIRPARKAHPALLVADLGALRTRLGAAGVVTRDEADPPAGYRRFYADDLFGNRLEFLQRES